MGLIDIFRKKKENLRYSYDLIYVDSKGCICFSNRIVSLQYTILRIRRFNCLDDDLIYKLVYEEYQKNYSIYDLYPILLTCKLPVILDKLPKKVLVNDDTYLGHILIKDEDYDTLHDMLKVPEKMENCLLNMFNRTIPYHVKEDTTITSDQFRRLIRTSYLGIWDNILHKPTSKVIQELSIFMNKNILFIRSLINPEYTTQATNVIERVAQEYKEDLK